MHKILLTIATIALLTGAIAAAVVWAPSQSEDGADHAAHHVGADEAALMQGPAGDMDHDGDGHPDTGMERPAFPVGEGSVPDADEARQLEEVSRLRILSDEDMRPSNGVRSGSGTLQDPYVISGYYVTGDLYLGDTDACVLIKENYIGGQLSLNWNGQCVHVHHNYVSDLRVNENIMRTGYATGGLIEYNKIGFLGQLRHYDGEFRHNIVGPFTSTNIFDQVLETVPVPFVEGFRVANVDGFNQGLLHHNTFYGSVDLDLHGHHHGTGFFAPHSHYHGSDEGRMAHHEHDHTQRWTSVAFTDNLIVDHEGYGLRYEDRNHAGDDRTARSEDEDTLEMDHQHWTWVRIEGNTVEGSGIWVDVFNADDENHHTRNDGWLDIRDNTVHLVERKQQALPFVQFQVDPMAGIQVGQVKELQLRIEGNHVTWTPRGDKDATEELLEDLWGTYDQPKGIALQAAKDGEVAITGNTLEGFMFGVWARQLETDVAWRVADNTFQDVQQDVWYDESVANEPSA